MVLCAVISCSKRSEHDIDVSFHRLPAVHDREGKEDFELVKSEEMVIWRLYHGKILM